MRSRAALLVLLALPLAGAQGEAEEIVFDAPLFAEGRIALSSARGYVDLASLVGDLSIAFDRGYLDELTRDRLRVSHAGISGPNATIGVGSESRELGPGVLALERCASGCLAVLEPATPPSRVGVEGAISDSLVWTRSRRIAWLGPESVLDRFFVTVPQGAFATGPADDEFLVRDARPFADGVVFLHLWNVSGTLDGVPYATGATETHRSLAAGASATESSSRLWTLTLVGARFETSGADTLSFVGDAAAVSIEGALVSDRARGVFDGRSYAGEPLRWTGAALLRLDLEEDGLDPATGAASLRARTVGAPLAASASAPTPVEAEEPRRAAWVLAASAVAILAALRFAVAALYSRIDRDRALSHEGRRRLLDALAATPGQGVSQLARNVAMARPVVRHHLRVLHMHDLVLPRRIGGGVRWFVVGAALSAADATLAATLEDPTRRRVAEVVAAAPRPLAPHEVAAAAGVSRRLAGYHLARLAGHGLLARTEGGGWPRYTPSSALLGLLGQG